MDTNLVLITRFVAFSLCFVLVFFQSALSAQPADQFYPDSQSVVDGRLVSNCNDCITMSRLLSFVSPLQQIQLSDLPEPVTVLLAMESEHFPLTHQQDKTWTQHQATDVILVMLLIIQAILIGIFLVQRFHFRRIKSHLSESELRFRNMADTAPVMIWVSDVNNRVDFLNKAWLTFKGCKLEDEIGRDWMEELHPVDKKYYQHAIEASFKNHTPFHAELRLRSKDGEFRWLICKGIPRYTTTNTFCGFIGSAVDITERRQQEIDLQASEERYRQLIESQLDLICRCLPDTTLTFVNEAYCRFFGMSRDELMGNEFIHLMSEQIQQSYVDQIYKVITQRQRCTFDFNMELKNGRCGWYQWEIYPIIDDQGDILEIQAIARDISDRKRAEEANQNLAHAMRLAVAGELTAMVAHEVSQPLGAIMANADAAQIMLNSSNPPIGELREILDDIRASDQRADQAVRQIRNLLRRHEMKIQPLDLNETVSTTLQLVRGDALQRNVKIFSELTPGLPQALGDQIYLQQVLLNLIINGMDAMSDVPRVSKQLVIQTETLNQNQIGVAVSDNGKGLKPENIDEIFGSFYTTKKNGMGLGLTICKSIIESHQGKIWVENKSNGGATFRFSLQVA